MALTITPAKSFLEERLADPTGVLVGVQLGCRDRLMYQV